MKNVVKLFVLTILISAPFVKNGCAKIIPVNVVPARSDSVRSMLPTFVLTVNYHFVLIVRLNVKSVKELPGKIIFRNVKCVELPVVKNAFRKSSERNSGIGKKRKNVQKMF